MQQKYYDQKHRDVRYEVGDLVLLSTRNIKKKGTPWKWQQQFVGPFRVTDTIGQQAYHLSLLNTWKIHPVVHVSLLKRWNAADLQEDQPISQEDAPEIEEPYYEIESILRWWKVKRGNKVLKEYLVLWKGYPVEDAMWVQASQFSYPTQLQEFLREDQPQEEKVKWWDHHFFEGGSSCGNS